MAPRRGVAERDDDDVADALGDLVIAPRATVGLSCRERLDTAELGLLAAQRVEDERGRHACACAPASWMLAGHEAIIAAAGRRAVQAGPLAARRAARGRRRVEPYLSVQYE